MTDLLELLLLACAAAFYPALLAVVIIFLGQPRPKRLLFYFLVGAMLGSVTIGLVCVFALDAANLGSDSRRSLGTGLYFAIGILALYAAGRLLGEPRPKKEKKKKEGPSMTDRVLTRDRAWLLVLLGIVINMPGLWYLVGLKDIALGGYSDAQKVVLVVAFNVVMFMFIELPLIGYVVDPEWTRAKVDAFNTALHKHARHIGGYVALVIGLYLIGRGFFLAL
jgi:Sap-like sulfolipid-1-addressing protein